ncbi:MAG: LytTR family DNA-binding domain-containing protein [Eubacteriaceae bacterium]|nr:LytTR family DNA-binding domain-containing protein [Eubacteriaceae bacterium]
MRVAICEDERYWQEALEASVCEWARQREVDAECLSFYGPAALLEALGQREGIDCVLLDIMLGDDAISGMGLAKAIRQAGSAVPIIFVTNDSSCVFDGYVVEAMGYLSKPADQSRLFMYLDRALKLKGNSEPVHEALDINSGGMIVSVRKGDIAYAEVLAHKVTYHAAGRAIESRGTLKGALDLLGAEGFVQVHRSYIIAVGKIHSIKATIPYAVFVRVGFETKKLAVSRKYIGNLVKAYADNALGKIS